jgi:hypothetical protein
MARWVVGWRAVRVGGVARTVVEVACCAGRRCRWNVGRPRRPNAGHPEGIIGLLAPIIPVMSSESAGEIEAVDSYVAVIVASFLSLTAQSGCTPHPMSFSTPI